MAQQRNSLRIPQLVDTHELQLSDMPLAEWVLDFLSAPLGYGTGAELCPTSERLQIRNRAISFSTQTRQRPTADTKASGPIETIRGRNMGHCQS
jgi:hypothetical protein